MNKQKRLHNYYLLLIGQTVSQFGSAMTAFSLVIWAYTQKGEVMASSLLAICSMVPYLIVSLPGGAVADKSGKKTVLLVCDTLAAAGSLTILLCFFTNHLQLWILCAVNILNGFMNAFQGPASQTAVSLLIDKEDYVRIGGLQSAVGSISGMIQPVLSAAVLSIGGLGLVLAIDLFTFLFAFITLLLWVQIPETVSSEEKTSFRTLKKDMLEGVRYLKTQRALLLLLAGYSVLELTGAISFDSMYSPLLLARTGNSEMTVGMVSAFMAAGCVASSLLLMRKTSPKKKIPVMFFGSFLCLFGITFFGMGRNIWQWCAVAFFGCFGSPIYSTLQTAVLREKVPLQMQGRMFSIQGMITQMLAPVGYLLGAFLADYVLEPFMKHPGTLQTICGKVVGNGAGSGIGLIFVLAGLSGIIINLILCRSREIRSLDSIESCNERK
ncbi:MAG: MFS transporter [Eubacteriales bacterium]|nr:MFS transporter [Eubacteriales bacterium]